MVILILSFLLLYVLAMKTYNKRRHFLIPFTKQYIAHRGLFDNNSNSPENSLNAFKNAINYNYGIELDIQLTKDNVLVVFHDFTVDRMLPIKGRVDDYTYDELLQYKLLNSTQTIPTFAEVLQTINGKVPLIIEFKGNKNVELLCLKAIELLSNYSGIYCIESFNPLVVYWFKVYKPDIIRGQLSTDYFKDHYNHPIILKYLLTNCLTNIITKPDFVAYNHLYHNNLCNKILRNIFHANMVTWTIQSSEQLVKNKKYFDIFIFDSFKPKG